MIKLSELIKSFLKYEDNIESVKWVDEGVIEFKFCFSPDETGEDAYTTLTFDFYDGGVYTLEVDNQYVCDIASKDSIIVPDTFSYISELVNIWLEFVERGKECDTSV